MGPPELPRNRRRRAARRRGRRILAPPRAAEKVPASGVNSRMRGSQALNARRSFNAVRNPGNSLSNAILVEEHEQDGELVTSSLACDRNRREVEQSTAALVSDDLRSLTENRKWSGTCVPSMPGRPPAGWTTVDIGNFEARRVPAAMYLRGNRGERRGYSARRPSVF